MIPEKKADLLLAPITAAPKKYFEASVVSRKNDVEFDPRKFDSC